MTTEVTTVDFDFATGATVTLDFLKPLVKGFATAGDGFLGMKMLHF